MSVTKSAPLAPETNSVRRNVLILAWPAVLEQLLNMSVGLVDTYIVGHLGASQLAGVGLSMQTLQIVWAVFSAIGVGSTALVARHIGAKEHKVAERVAQQSMVLAFVAGCFSSFLVWFTAPLVLRWLGADPDVIALGTIYMRAVSTTVFMLSVLFVGSAILRGIGDTRTPMLVMLVVNVVNIVVAYTLANGIGPFPHLGVLGSGIGAAAGRGLGGLIMVVVLVRGRRAITIGRRIPQLDTGLLRRILHIGIPAAAEQVLMRMGQILLVSVITSLGTIAVAAHQVAINALSVAYMPGWGFALAATTLVGQELGAHRPDRASQSAYEALRMVTVLMTVMGLLVALFPEPLMRVFTEDKDVIIQGGHALRIAGLAMPFLGVSFTLAGGLRGAGDTTATLIISAGEYLAGAFRSRLVARTTDGIGRGLDRDCHRFCHPWLADVVAVPLRPLETDYSLGGRRRSFVATGRRKKDELGAVDERCQGIKLQGQQNFIRPAGFSRPGFQPHFQAVSRDLFEVQDQRTQIVAFSPSFPGQSLGRQQSVDPRGQVYPGRQGDPVVDGQQLRLHGLAFEFDLVYLEHLQTRGNCCLETGQYVVSVQFLFQPDIDQLAFAGKAQRKSGRQVQTWLAD